MKTLIQTLLVMTGRKWKIGGVMSTPSEDDVKKVLDSAAKALYNEDIGSTFTMGGLYIEKAADGYDVYVHVGQYT